MLFRSTGFKFTEYTGEALLVSIKSALAAFRDPTSWQKLMKNGMAKDFSWNTSAKEYAKVYEKVRKMRTAGGAATIPAVSLSTPVAAKTIA